MSANREHWQNLPFEETAPIPYAARFSVADHAKLAEGLIPQVMEDKWFVFMDGSQLNFHRSWTGLAVYQVTLERAGDGYDVTQPLCACSVLLGSNPDYQAQLLDFLISNLLLNQSKPFPKPSGQIEPLPGAYQHHIVGTGYPETRSPPAPKTKHRPWWKFWDGL